MSYSNRITRANPTLFIFLVDQSGSMARSWGGDTTKSLSQGTADSINHLLHDIVFRSTYDEGGVRDYFNISIIGYGNNKIDSGISSRSIDQLPASLNEIADTKTEERTRKVEDGTGGLVEENVRVPIWMDPVANGNTPMCEALNKSYDIVDKWIASHQDSFPPTVINITDGEPTDGNPEPISEKIRNLHTDDGNVLLFNIHISPLDGKEIIYPSTDESLPDDNAKRLFRMSSVLPALVRDEATRRGYTLDDNARGFVFNAGLVTLIQALNIGTGGTQSQVEGTPPVGITMNPKEFTEGLTYESREG